MSSTAGKEVRYGDSADPVRTDGRDIDSTLGELSGEASGQQVKSGDPHLQEITPRPWREPPPVDAEDPTYYGRPLLKKSVWSIDIPLYYFTGGAAGAALALGAALQLRNRPELRRLAQHCHWIGIAGSTLGGALLIHDLGRPSRFLNMLRVFRPTSPMNMGAWILGGAAPTAIATGLFINRPGALGAIGNVMGYLAGLFGAALAGYTGVLVSNSAIPVWQDARRWMPVLFVGSAMASAASILDLMYEDEAANRVSFLFGTAGRIAEIAASKCVEASASVVPKVGEPFRKGATSLFWKTATALTVASLVLSMMPVKSSRKRHVAGVLGALGSLAMRFAVHYISNASAREPRASFHQQRARMESPDRNAPAG